jgi:mitochondrial fission protein ELM1
MQAPDRKISCWVVTDGRAGIEAQALGLAEAVADIRRIEISTRRLAVQAPFRMLPRALWGDPFSRLHADSAPLTPPWPDLWIGCGRLSVPFSIEIKKKSPSTFVVQLQNPRAPLSDFDLVIAPEHDGLSAPNVVSIIGPTMRVRKRALTAAPDANKVAVLIGGPNKVFRFDVEDAALLSDKLLRLAGQGYSLFVTTSRRTPQAAARVLEERLAGSARVFWRADCGEIAANPYPAMLDGAGAVLVTEDSVNMAAEAASTGAPVHLLGLRRAPFRSAAKFDLFHQSLIKRGALRYFDGGIERFAYAPLDETKRAARELIERLR